MSAQRIPFDRLAWMAAALGCALLPALPGLPAWIGLTIAAAILMRLALARASRDLPPALLRLAVSGIAIALLFLQFHTFNGITAGSALLALMAGLKFLEARTLRDMRIIAMIVYFLCLASLLTGTSLGLLLYLLAAAWLTTGVLLRFTLAQPAPRMWPALRFAARLLLLALPLAIALWLFFPRFAGPLWHLPSSESAARSGLGERMSPGDLSELSLSDEVAMRVRFEGAPPPPRQRYWRGPVLDVFDGRSWMRSAMDDVPAPPPSAAPPAAGATYRYRISLEPHSHGWLLALEQPLRWDAPRAFLTPDQVLMQPEPVSRPLDLMIESRPPPEGPHPVADMAGDLRDRRRQVRLPANRNPRTLDLARQLRAASASDVDFAAAVLELFRREKFYYTLSPPRLAQDPVDEFLFDTRRGFCEHYASAFAALMRAGGVPARIVTGYQGGTFNRFAGYWIVRQSDAHAWNEIWLEGRGWVRADPTAAIAPERIERGPAGVPSLEALSEGGWYLRSPWLADLRLRLDALRQAWREAILRYDQQSQYSLLERLHVPEPDADKLVISLTLALVLTSLWLGWQMRRDAARGSRDPLVAAWQELQRRLQPLGIPAQENRTPRQLCAQLRRQCPAIAPQVVPLCERYEQLRYGRGDGDPAARTAAVRALRLAVRRLSRRTMKT
ncbi:MAG: DUF3488 and transglutaminase-like domain-containing protein [Steroidobacteraceae bacterium]